MLDYRELITPETNPDTRHWQVTMDHRHHGSTFRFVDADSWQAAEAEAVKQAGYNRADILTVYIHERN